MSRGASPPARGRARPQTLPERLVADALRAFPDYEVRQEVKVGPYWLDFLVGWRLGLEVDGKPWHAAGRDSRRDAYLAERAIAVAHLPAADVLRLSPLALIERLDDVIRAHEHAARYP